MTELNLAVLHSFGAAGVTISRPPHRVGPVPAAPGPRGAARPGLPGRLDLDRAAGRVLGHSGLPPLLPATSTRRRTSTATRPRGCRRPAGAMTRLARRRSADRAGAISGRCSGDRRCHSGRAGRSARPGSAGRPPARSRLRRRRRPPGRRWPPCAPSPRYPAARPRCRPAGGPGRRRCRCAGRPAPPGRPGAPGRSAAGPDVQGRHGCVPGPGVRVLQDHVRVLLRLAHDLIAAQPGLLGDPAAVGLGVSHVPVSGGLRGRQDLHGVNVRVRLAEQHGLRVALGLAGQDPAAQPLHFLPQRGPLVHQPHELGLHRVQERPDRLLVKPAPPQP